ncbi:MAG: hypothetical protein ACLRRI_02615 [Oscillospiraceae bacterium]
MKKIIATVLAMVMALALCTTAFAADNYTEKTATPPLTLEKVFTKDGDTSGQYYIKTGTDKYRVATDAETAVINAGGYNKATLAKMTDEGYLFEVYQDAAGKYYAKAAVVDAYDKEKGTAIAQNSVVYFGKDLASAVAYYAYDSNTNLKVAEAVTVLYKTTATFGANKAAVYTNLAGTATYALVGDVDSTDKDKDAVGNLSKIFYERPNDYATLLNKAGKDIKLAADSGYYYVLTEKAASTTTNTNKPSPKTFDAGIAMYVGMALTSVAGSAVVIGKKKEF